MERNKINNPSLVELPLPDTTRIERQVLVNAAADPEDIPDYVSFITEEMFTTPDRKRCWREITKMYAAGEDINTATIYAKVGKETALAELMPEGYTPEYMGGANHALLLRDAATKRKAYQAALQIIYKSCDPALTETDILKEITALADQVESGTIRPEESGMMEIVNAIAEDIQQWKKQTEAGKRIRIPAGFPDLDNVCNKGWAPGQLIILAARPSVGKTALMVHFAKAAARENFKVAIFTLEMTKKEIGSRLLISTDKMESSDFYDGSVKWEDFERAAKEVTPLPILINDSETRPAGLVSRIHSLHNRGKCDIAFIDYLGLFRNENYGRTPLYQLIAENTSMLKATAKRLGIPIVLLCQLNRDSARSDRAPELYDLRDSGSIEQDADVVLMLDQKDDTILPDLDYPLDINLWIRKNRNGKKDLALTLHPNRSYTNFTEIDFFK